MIRNDEDCVSGKMILWYFIGSVVWFLLASMIPTHNEAMPIILVVGYVSLTFGFAIGFQCRNLFLKKTWLVMFIPILHILFLIFF